MGRRRPPAAHARDVAVRRLRRLTASAAAGGTALAAVFAGLAAQAVPGRKSVGVSAGATGALRLPAPERRPQRRPAERVTTITTSPPATVTTPAPTVAPPVPASTAAPAPAPAPAPPPVRPAPTAAPPVVVSGGS